VELPERWRKRKTGAWSSIPARKDGQGWIGVAEFIFSFDRACRLFSLSSGFSATICA
jgi:hypothetical protein